MKAAIHLPIVKLIVLIGKAVASRRGLPPGPIPDSLLPRDLGRTNPLAASLFPEDRSASAS